MMYVRTLAIGIAASVPLFVGAGRWVSAFAVYVVMLWLVTGTILTVLRLKSPELLAERLKPPSDRERATRRIALPLMLMHYLIAGLDVGRFGWSTARLSVQIAGFVAVFGSFVLTAWTLLSNPYASAAVRIQAERGHTVITTGPYAFVRHPMYLGVLFFVLGSGPALGSWWSELVMLPVLVVFVRRTLIEDRTLHDELPGYAAYARRVRFRVIPGLF